MQEHVILLDEHGSPIGMEKYAAITITPRCISPSSWLFNSQGECLVTRRAMGKKPGRASGPTPLRTSARGETLEQAMVAAAAMKWGRYYRHHAVAGFRYRETDPSGIVENEFARSLPHKSSRHWINTEEVMDISGLNLMPSSARWRNARAFSPWMVLEAAPTRNSDSLPPASGNKAPAHGAFSRLNDLFYRTHRREQDHVADGVAVGKQHNHTVDTNTQTRGRRQTVFQRGHVVFVVEHRFVVACGFRINLILEALRLIFGIVQLAKAVTDKELKAVGDFRVHVITTRQRRTSAGYSVMKVG
jgi:isopentenyl-diphosphate delta-isomerase